MVVNVQRIRSMGGVVVGILSGFSVGTLLDRASLRIILTGAQGLHYTNEQVETVFICGLFGLSFGLPVAVLQRRLRCFWLAVISCLCSTVAFLLLWSASIHHGWYEDKMALIALYNFLAGHSVAYLYYTSLWVNLGNWPDHCGKVVLLHNGPLVSSAVLMWLVLEHMRFVLLWQIGLASFSAFLAIFLLRPNNRCVDSSSGRITADVRRLTTPAFEYPASDIGRPRPRKINLMTCRLCIEYDVGSSVDGHASSRAAGDSRSTLADGVGGAHLACPTSMLGIRSRRLRRLATRPRVLRRSGFTVLTLLGSLFNDSPSLALGLISALLAGLHADAFGSVPRGNALTLVIFTHALLLLFGVADRQVLHLHIPMKNMHSQAVGVNELLDASGGLVQGAVWVLTPLILHEKFGRGRLTMLWSAIIGVFTISSAIEALLILRFLTAQSANAVCSTVTCPMMVSMLRLAITLAAIIWSCALSAC